MNNFNISAFRALINDNEFALWFDSLMPTVNEKIKPDSQRNFPDWLAALDSLPQVVSDQLDLQNDTVTTNSINLNTDNNRIRDALMLLSPWRKGPFNLHGVHIDSEWRCDWKWNRIKHHIDLQDRTVLDVGSGNGYYSLRMLGAGAKHVVGMDTSLLFCTQFQAVSRFTQNNQATVLPLGVEILTQFPFQFNTVFSMGVLYHRRQPAEHLKLLYDNLTANGELILETLILRDHTDSQLIPQDRYANMRNVWSVPTLPYLMKQLEQAGFKHASCVDITQTSTAEQRATEWMTFRSLQDALNPENADQTVEGYQSPLRAVIIAKK